MFTNIMQEHQHYKIVCLYNIMCLASPYITEAVTVADSLVIYCLPVWARALHDIPMSLLC